MMKKFIFLFIFVLVSGVAIAKKEGKPDPGDYYPSDIDQGMKPSEWDGYYYNKNQKKKEASRKNEKAIEKIRKELDEKENCQEDHVKKKK